MNEFEEDYEKFLRRKQKEKFNTRINYGFNKAPKPSYKLYPFPGFHQYGNNEPYFQPQCYSKPYENCQCGFESNSFPQYVLPVIYVPQAQPKVTTYAPPVPHLIPPNLTRNRKNHNQYTITKSKSMVHTAYSDFTEVDDQIDDLQNSFNLYHNYLQEYMQYKNSVNKYKNVQKNEEKDRTYVNLSDMDNTNLYYNTNFMSKSSVSQTGFDREKFVNYTGVTNNEIEKKESKENIFNTTPTKIGVDVGVNTELSDNQVPKSTQTVQQLKLNSKQAQTVLRDIKRLLLLLPSEEIRNSGPDGPNMVPDYVKIRQPGTLKPENKTMDTHLGNSYPMSIEKNNNNPNSQGIRKIPPLRTNKRMVYSTK